RRQDALHGRGREDPALPTRLPEVSMKRSLSFVLVLALGGCATEGGTGIAGWENWQSGALIGAGVGAAVGAAAYSRNRTQGALIGAVGGGLAGGAVGAYMDSQRKDLEKNLAKEI